MKKLIFYFIAFCAIAPVIFAVGPQDLVYMSEQYEPFNYEENGVAKGVAVEVLQLMWKEMGCPEQKIDFKIPWARSYNMVQTNPNTVLFAMSRTPARETMFKWVGPIYTLKFGLIGLASKNIKIDTIADANKYKIGVINKDIAEALLQSKGVTNLEGVAEMDFNIKKLLTGRIDLIGYNDKALMEQLKANNLDPAQFKTYFIFGEQGSCYAFYKGTDDALIAKFQAAFDKVKKSGKLDEIMKKYGQ